MEILVLHMIIVFGLSLITADVSDNYKEESDLKMYNTLKCIDNKQGSGSSSILHQYAGCHKKDVSQQTERDFIEYRYKRDISLGKK